MPADPACCRPGVPPPWGGGEEPRPGRSLGALVLLAGLILLLALPALPGDRTWMSLDGPLAMGPWVQERPDRTGHPRNPHLGDQDFLYYPFLRVIGRELAERGELPLWNPHLYGGVPLAGNAQFPLLYPGHLPLWLSQVGGDGFDARAFDRAFTWHALLRLAICALGAWLWFRRLGAGRTAALLGAMCLGAGGYMVVWLQFTPAQVFCFIPPALFFLESRIQGRSAWHLAGYALAFGSSNLGGYPQTSFFFGLFLLLYTLFRVGWRPRRLAPLLLASLAGVLLALPSFLPFLEYLDLSNLKGMRKDDVLWPEGVSPWHLVLALAGALGLFIAAWRCLRRWAPWGGVVAGLLAAGALLLLDSPALGADGQLLNLVLPSVWGRPEVGTWVLSANPNAVEVNADFIGAGALLLLLLSPWVVRRSAGPAAFLLATALLVWAYGAHLPLLHQLGRTLLYIAQASRAAVLFPICGAALAVFTLDRLAAMPPAARRGLGPPLLAITTGVVVVALAQLTGLWQGAADLPANWLARVATGSPHLWIDLLLLAAALGCLWWLLAARETRLPRTLLVAVTGAHLLAFGWGFNTVTRLDQVYPPTPALTWLQERDREARAAGRPFRVLGDRMMLRPNQASVFGLADVRGHDCFDPARYLLLWQGLSLTDQPREVGHRTLRMEHWAFDLLGVRYYLTPERWQPTPGWREVKRIAGTGIYERRRPLPRAFLVSRGLYIHEKDEQGRIPFLRPQMDPSRQVFLEDRQTSLPGPAMSDGRARIVEDAPNRVVVETEADGWSWLVLMDNFYPGWRADLDGGRELEIKSAYCTWRCVVVPPGSHRVTFNYSPASWRRGLVLAGAGLLLIAGLILVERRRRGAAPPRD